MRQTWILLCLFSSTALFAQDNTLGVEPTVFDVTITNVTKNQIFSPPIAVTHNSDLSLFTPGYPASGALATMAEDGDAGPLKEDVLANESAFFATISEGPLLPGQSVTLKVETYGMYNRISVLGMLVTTNDAFFAARGIQVPRTVYVKRAPAPISVTANVYDAGSEANTEDCAHIPGPPCGNGCVRVTDGAEGYVHIHNGVHGIGSIDAASYDWRNPGAVITVKLSKD